MPNGSVAAISSRGFSAARGREVWTPLLLLFLGWLVLSWPWLAGGFVIPWDAKNHFYPILRFVAQSLHSDQSPAWNPYHMGGHPMISDPQSMLFSPLMIGLAALVEKPSMHLVDAVQLLHLLIGGAGVLLLCRSFRWHPAAGLAAAIVFMFGGSAAGRLQHTGMILSYGFLPCCLLLLKLALDRASIGWGVAFGLVAAIMAANRDQVAYLGCLMLIAYGFWRLWTVVEPAEGHAAAGAPTANGRGAFVRTRLPAVVAAFIVGVAALAVPLLLTMEFVTLSNRPAITYDTAVTGSLAPVNFITLLAPDYFKSISTLTDYWGPGGRAWDIDDWTDRSVTYLYAGLLPVALIAWYGIVAGWLKSREIRFFLVLLVAATVYSVGKHTPVFRYVFNLVPGVDLYRRPADATFILNFALAMVGGYLLHRLLRDGAPRISRNRLLAATVTALGLFALYVGIAVAHGQQAHALKTLLLAAAGLAGTGLVLRQIGRERMRRPAWIAVALLLLAVDLRMHNTGTFFNAQDPRQLASFEGSSDDNMIAAVLQEHLEQAAEEGLEGPYRAEILGLGGIWQNAPMIFNIEATLGYNPLRLETYEAATGASETSHESRRRFSSLMRSYRSTLANLLGIRFICTTVPIETVDPSLRPGDFKLVDQIGKVRIYENPRAFPRAFVVEKALPVDTEAVLRTGVMPTTDFRTTVLLDPMPANWHAVVKDDPAAEPPTAVVTSYTNTEIQVQVKASKPSFLVLNDLFYPYWRAYVDGQETEILNANVLFRAVPVQPGEHEVVFRFEPLSWDSIVAVLKD